MAHARPDLRQGTAGQSRILLLLDFDGTLSEIAPRPQDAVLRAGNGPLLERLAQNSGCTVGVVSGRSLDDVSRRVGVAGLVYAGNHGLEIRGPGLDYVHPAAANAVPVIAGLYGRLAAALERIPGAFVEDKTLTLTVHFRQTPPRYHNDIAAIFQDATQRPVADGLCRVTAAKCALELRPAVDWHKGRALELIRSRFAPTALPLYVGDDATDEDAFRSAQAAGGVGIFVGPADSDTKAVRRLDAPSAVTGALSDLLGQLQRTPGFTGFGQKPE